MVETDSVGCVGDTVILVVQLVTSAEITAYTSVKMIVYPNPFNHNATVIFSNETQDNYELLLYDMLSNKVRVMENITSNEISNGDWTPKVSLNKIYIPEKAKETTYLDGSPDEISEKLVDIFKNEIKVLN